MAKYDEPGYTDSLPGIGIFPRPDTTPGTTGLSAGTETGPVVGTPVVSTPGASSQVPANMPRATVTAGDTASASDDTPVHTGPLLPGNPGEYLSTGAGDGGVDHFPHRNSLGKGKS
jgi:hypothetical protein